MAPHLAASPLGSAIASPVGIAFPRMDVPGGMDVPRGIGRPLGLAPTLGPAVAGPSGPEADRTRATPRARRGGAPAGPAGGGEAGGGGGEKYRKKEKQCIFGPVLFGLLFGHLAFLYF